MPVLSTAAAPTQRRAGNASSAANALMSVVECQARVAALAARIANQRTIIEAKKLPFAAFSTLYVDVTEGLMMKLISDPRYFENPGAIVRFIERFAGRYFDGVNAVMYGTRSRSSADDAAPPAVGDGWLEVANAARNLTPRMMGELFCGVAVHVTYDLPIVLSSVELTPEFVRDFTRFNQVLDAIQPRLRQHLIARHGLPKTLLGRIIFRFSSLAAKSVGSMRVRATENALRIQRGDPTVLPELRRKVRAAIARIKPAV